MKDPLTFSRFGFWALVTGVIPVIAILFTWATGYLFVSFGSGGLPLPWRELVFQSCPLIIACQSNICTCISRIVQVNFDWLSFAIDVLFYTGVGYSMVLAYAPTGLALNRLAARLIQRVQPKYAEESPWGTAPGVSTDS